MNLHSINQCKHGVIVAQCRCPAVAKPVTIVNCPTSCYVEGRAHGPDTSIKPPMTEEDALAFYSAATAAIDPPPTMQDRVRYGIKAAEAEMERRGLILRDGYGAPYLIDGLIETAVKAALKS